MGKSKILIIEDEEFIAQLLLRMLESMGYDPAKAKNLKEGYEKFDNFDPHVVLLDLNLPDGSGFSAIPELKKENPLVKIIIVSAYDGPKERKRASLEGADFFIGKPFNKDIIKNALENTLGNNSN